MPFPYNHLPNEHGDISQWQYQELMSLIISDDNIKHTLLVGSPAKGEII